MKNYNYGKNGGYYTSIGMKLPDEHVSSALKLIASLIGDKDQMHNISDFKLTGDMLPDNLGFEKSVLRVLYDMSANNVRPTEWNIIERLTMDYPDARQQLTRLLDNHGSVNSDPLFWAWNISDWLERHRMLAAAKEIEKLFANNVGTSRDAYEQAMSIMMEVAPRLMSAETKTAEQTIKEFAIVQKEDYERHKNKVSPGPSMPWEDLNKQTGFHKEGDMWTWMAKTKHGKSTIAVALAYHFLLYHCNDEIPYDIGYYHLETERMDLQKRWISSQLDLSLDDMRTIDIANDERTAKPYAKVVRYVNGASKRAEMEYIFCPGIGFNELVSIMADRKARSAARGRKYIAIIDYYQEIDGSALGRTETDQYNKMATELKNAFQSLRIYGHVFAQYNIDSDFKTKRSSYNGAKLMMRSQMVIGVEREYDADMDSRATWGHPPYDLATDILGNPIYFHRKGNVSSLANFHVLMTNGDGGGSMGVVPLRFVNKYFKIVGAGEVNGAPVMPLSFFRRP